MHNCMLNEFELVGRERVNREFDFVGILCHASLVSGSVVAVDYLRILCASSKTSSSTKHSSLLCCCLEL